MSLAEPTQLNICMRIKNLLDSPAQTFNLPITYVKKCEKIIAAPNLYITVYTCLFAFPRFI